MVVNVLELFAGIGGVARAFQGLAKIIAAIDINQNAQRVYQQNFNHPYLVRAIEDFSSNAIDSFGCNTWWASAPCQPFTRRGNQMGELDSRSSGLRHLIELLQEVPPEHFLMENVVGFADSGVRDQLTKVLLGSGFEYVEIERCPTELGIPNRRPRYYLIASRSLPVGSTDFGVATLSSEARHLDMFLDESLDDQFDLDGEQFNRYWSGINVVSELDATSNCFTSAYGKSISKSGSFVQRTPESIRRFSPAEIARLLGFQSSEFTNEFQFPAALSIRQLWKLLGNSVSVFVVRDLIKKCFYST